MVAHNFIKRARRLSSRTVIGSLAAVVMIAALGVYMVARSQAATIVVAGEAEGGTVAGLASRHSGVAGTSGLGTVSFGIVTPPPIDGDGRTVNVTTGSELSAAIADALPGDKIHMADGVYEGKLLVGKYTGAFSIVKGGTAMAPVELTGSRAAVIDAGGTGGHYGLYIAGASYWDITGITVTNASKGIVMDGGNHITLKDVRVYNIGAEAVHFRAFSSDNIIEDSLVEQTGVKQAQYGEGVYIGSANSNWATYSGGQPDGSNRNKVLNNIIRNTGGENIDIKEGTVAGVIDGNQFDGVNMQGENSADSWIDVKGNGYTITNNKGVVSSSTGTVFNNGIELHQAVVGWGINNIFHKNVLNLANATGAGFYQQKGLTGNILSCDNVVTDAVKGFGIYNVSPQACND